MRDRASYINEARAILRKTLLVLGFNGLLLILLDGSGGMASPGAHGSPIILMAGLLCALMVPFAEVSLDAKRKFARDYGLYLGLVGTTLLWTPLYLETMFGRQADWILDLSYAGVALLIGSLFWPTRAASE